MTRSDSILLPPGYRAVEGMIERAVSIPAGSVKLDGDLSLPSGSEGIVLFAHGSGSSRHSPRNRQVARTLNGLGLSTLLMDLLSPGEEAVDRRTARFRFDIELLGERLVQATDWTTTDDETSRLQIGYFGASTGAAAALLAASRRPRLVRAIVSRGGRPDLAGPSLARVDAPTLLIVGSLDVEVLALNQAAAAELTAPHEISIVEGATHLFEEPGKLDEVATLAGRWFVSHLDGATTDV
jgi:putative phosphoribosyl transferase